MKNSSKIALFAALMVPSVAFAQVNVGDTLGASEDAIRGALEAQGYAITEIEIEGGEIEVEASLDGTAYEFEVSAETGKVLEIELDDDVETEDS